MVGVCVCVSHVYMKACQSSDLRESEKERFVCVRKYYVYSHFCYVHLIFIYLVPNHNI